MFSNVTVTELHMKRNKCQIQCMSYKSLCKDPVITQDMRAPEEC